MTQSLRDTAGFGALSASLRSDWDQALEHYGRALAERDILFDSMMVKVNVGLSRIDANASPTTVALDAEHARAASAYANWAGALRRIAAELPAAPAR